MNNIVDYLAKQKSLLMPVMDEFISKQVDKYGGLTNEYCQLLDHIRKYLLRGGKWHRPALALLAYEIAGGRDLKAVFKAALVTEIMHRFFLVHDDIIDQDLMRHNGPTIEKIYRDYFAETFGGKDDVIFSKGNAIVAGDVVNTLGYALIADAQIDAETSMALVAAINQMIMETAAGWQLQNEQNYRPIKDVTYEDFFQGMQLVSCQYSIVWPLRIGQILAGRLESASWDTDLDTYGWHCGATFQIVDDIIGMFGDEEATGKPSGHDYREGKKTHLVLRAYERGSRAQKQFLIQTLGTQVSAADLDRVRQIMTETEALAYSQELARTHASQALAALKKVNHRSEKAHDLLADFSRFLESRIH